MKYITITSKHHDGFAMFDSHLTDWTVVQRTPYGKDVSDACGGMSQAGHQAIFLPLTIGLAFAGLFSAWSTGHHTGRPEAGNWDAYLNFMDGQLKSC